MKSLTGRVRKSDLVLREQNGIDANLTSAPNVAQAVIKAKETMNRNPNVSSVSADAGKLDGSSDMQSGEGMKLQVPVNASSQELSTAQTIVKSQNNDDMQIQFTKPVTNGQVQDDNSVSESVNQLRRTMPEFTKKDFDQLLRSI